MKLFTFFYLIAMFIRNNNCQSYSIIGEWVTGIGTFDPQSPCCIPLGINITATEGSTSNLLVIYNFSNTAENPYCTQNNITGPTSGTAVQEGAAFLYWTDSTNKFQFTPADSFQVQMLGVEYFGYAKKQCSYQLYPPGSGPAENGYSGQMFGVWQTKELSRALSHCCAPTTITFGDSYTDSYKEGYLDAIYQFGSEVANNTHCVDNGIYPSNITDMLAYQPYSLLWTGINYPWYGASYNTNTTELNVTYYNKNSSSTCAFTMTKQTNPSDLTLENLIIY
jgi:hypothetical protein